MKILNSNDENELIWEYDNQNFLWLLLEQSETEKTTVASICVGKPYNANDPITFRLYSTPEGFRSEIKGGGLESAKKQAENFHQKHYGSASKL